MTQRYVMSCIEFGVFEIFFRAQVAQPHSRKFFIYTVQSFTTVSDNPNNVGVPRG